MEAGSVAKIFVGVEVTVGPGSGVTVGEKVIVGAFVGLKVGVTPGKLVSAGLELKALQEVNTATRTERITSLLMVFILSLCFV